ncbi:hypothetical protein [Streptomyces sp. NPDC059814]|uniref:hypothetical protein n=1 Tax=Streptomyces sp. NPDC059814 TaxID=3346959 RepID=UPI00366969B7
MLNEVLIAAAATGGGAIVQAAGTDSWNGVREAAARLLGRSDVRREQAELERLDRTRVVLEATDEGEAERVQTAVWQTRFEALLEELPNAGRQQVASELEHLAALAGAARPTERMHNDFRDAQFDHSQVQGSGTMTVTNNYAE